jgi:hypothetical protein
LHVPHVRPAHRTGRQGAPPHSAFDLQTRA